MVFPEPFLAHSNSQPATASVNDAKALLAAAIDKLSPMGRLVVCLLYHEALDIDEVAAVLDLERTAVERLRAAALRSFMQQVA